MQNHFNLYFTALEKPQADIDFPTPLIHSLGEKKNKTKPEQNKGVIEKMTDTVLHYPQSPLSSLRMSLNFLVRYTLKS